MVFISVFLAGIIHLLDLRFRHVIVIVKISGENQRMPERYYPIDVQSGLILYYLIQ